MINNNIFKLGEVYSVNAAKHTCRVTFPDQDGVSSDLPIMTGGGTRNRERNLPKIGDQAVVALIAPSLSDGVVLGFTYNEVDLPPEGDENIDSTTYPDGTVISYDSKAHKLIIDCKGETTINTEVINLNGEVIINGKSWLEHQHKAGEYKDGDGKQVSGTSGDGVVS